MLVIRVCMERLKPILRKTLIQDKIKYENQTQCTLAPLELQSTCCLQKMGHGCMLSVFGKTKTNQNDHSPSMTLSSCLNKNDQVPQENCQKYLTQLLSWSIR